MKNMRHREMALKVLENVKERIGTDGIHLLSRMIDLDPNTRITPKEAIQHPFFDSIKHLIRHKFEPMLNTQNTLQWIPSYFYEKLLHLNKMNEKIQTKPKIDSNLRKISVDWLNDVAFHFKLRDETYYYAIRYLDIYLQTNPLITKDDYHLIATTCLKISDILNEISKEHYKQHVTKDYASMG